MGIGDAGIAAVGEDIHKTAMELLKELVDDESELISIYYGADIEEDKAQALADEAAEAFGECEVELQYGGQPIYYYMVSVE